MKSFRWGILTTKFSGWSTTLNSYRLSSSAKNAWSLVLQISRLGSKWLRFSIKSFTTWFRRRCQPFSCAASISFLISKLRSKRQPSNTIKSSLDITHCLVAMISYAQILWLSWGTVQQPSVTLRCLNFPLSKTADGWRKSGSILRLILRVFLTLSQVMTPKCRQHAAQILRKTNFSKWLTHDFWWKQ